jgi:hypothetical protein
MNYVVSKKWKEEKSRSNLLYQINQQFNPVKKNNKFCSFLKNSLLPRAAKYKFDYVLDNSKWNALKFKTPWNNICVEDKPEADKVEPYKNYRFTVNDEVTAIIYEIYFVFYFSLLYDFEVNEIVTWKDNVLDFFFLFNYSTLYYFYENCFYQFYIYNDFIKHIIYSYNLDFKYEYNYLFLYNYYIFFYISHFFVFLNLGEIKYEHDKVLTPPDKWDKIPKMDLDFFDFTEFTDYNFSNYNLYVYNDNIFYSFCVLECFIDYNFYFSNIFNIDFFHCSNLINKNNNLKQEYRSRNSLSNILYKDTKHLKKNYNKDFFMSDYDELSLILQSTDIEGLDYYNYMLDLRTFMVKIPYLFFFLYTWYTICYRNARYNLYIRSYVFFEEYTSKKHFFIMHNNPYGKNKTKRSYYKYQKAWVIDHFKLHLEERFFNKWFLFYSKRSYNLKRYIDYCHLSDFYSFKNLLNNFNLNLLFKVNELLDLEYFYDFYNDNLLQFFDEKNSVEGFKIVMKTRLIKFSNKFKLGRSTFEELDEMVEVVFSLSNDIYLYNQNSNKEMFFNLIFDIYNEKFINYFFLKDFFNFNDKNDLIKKDKMVNLYNKLIYLSFYIIDPYFLKYLWRKFFPRRIKQIRRAFHYLKYNMIQCGIRKNKRLNLLNYDYFHHYLNWRTDTSTSVQSNRFHQDRYSSSLSIINMEVKSRFIEVADKIKFMLNSNNIFNLYKLQHYIVLFKDFFVQFLGEHIEFLLFLFFFNIKKHFNIQCNNVWLNMHHMIDYNFIYRYYVYHYLFQYNYYIDWFNNRDKRVLWIFHRKDYKEHEGLGYYKKQFNEMF